MIDDDFAILRRIAAVVAQRALTRDAPPGVRIERRDDAIRAVRVADGAATAWRRHHRCETLARLVRDDIDRPASRIVRLAGGGVVTALVPAFCARNAWISTYSLYQKGDDDVQQ